MNDLKYGIHWFRRDLRVAGNKALNKQLIINNGAALGLCCIHNKELKKNHFSVHRFQFFLETLQCLQKELRLNGSDLLVLNMNPVDGISYVLETLKANALPLPSYLSWSNDYESSFLKDVQIIKEKLSSLGINYFHERDHLLIEPSELEKNNGLGYQVYSPFAKKWLNLFQTKTMHDRIKDQKEGISYLNQLEKNKLEKKYKLSWNTLFKRKKILSDSLQEFIRLNSKKVKIPIPLSGTLHAYKELKQFKQKHLNQYAETRDYPFLNGTSKLSSYLKSGSLTLPQIIYVLKLAPYNTKKTSQDVFFSELIWREFYFHILYHHPRVENEAFLEKFNALKWENNDSYFQAWMDGKTGFPIVDAGMRQLNTTGWMHNRVRMIVASFLTKDLLIDWRWGEQYFMENLLDGDLAANNGGWQWAASTGCDPQPYFRIFNPWLQSYKFDPDGKYIKKFIPELKNIRTQSLHEPIMNHPQYPPPIIDHQVQKKKALLLYK